MFEFDVEAATRAAREISRGPANVAKAANPDHQDSQISQISQGHPPKTEVRALYYAYALRNGFTVEERDADIGPILANPVAWSDYFKDLQRAESPDVQRHQRSLAEQL
jgi:hypothetical protein